MSDFGFSDCANCVDFMKCKGFLYRDSCECVPYEEEPEEVVDGD